MAAIKKHSGLQKQVLAAYRSLLRASIGPLRVEPRTSLSRCPPPSTAADTPVWLARANVYASIRDGFRANQKAVPVSAVAAVEHLVRRANKSLDMVRQNVDGISLPTPLETGRRFWRH
ncbi:hypothetical protein BC830DRAFT_1170396 [Chytriomyces sp. MP71]|nr:hypothetical protein BC830DRAFT_1170396 [Chytriomyces sp. MP71]